MKLIVFSDTHLTARFEPKKFEFMKRIINEADQVVINGDFWDGYLTTFDDFINSKWQGLFPLLKKKKAVYLWGNHDQASMADERVSLFSETVGYAYELPRTGGTKIKIEHGNRFLNSEMSHLSFLDARWARSMLYVVYWIGVELLGRWMFALNPFSSWQTYLLKKYVKQSLKDDEKIICGHTHQPYLAPHDNYLNCGYIQFGIGYYLIIEDGKFELIYSKFD